ncbi:MAG: hypothetical protein KatS3mg110_2494 [Pirellulaceae bacterium]|nr:MAG: hypothetical protein KatS3mg110_2494 [Pirellulaceae bacterium]
MGDRRVSPLGLAASRRWQGGVALGRGVCFCSAVFLAVALVFDVWDGRSSQAQSVDEAVSSGEGLRFYRDRVRPILARRCFTCHGGQAEVKGGLRLSNRQDLIKGGESGPAVDLESPEESLLLSAIRYEGLQMPPSGQLPESEIAVLTRWVHMGVPFDPNEEIFAPSDPEGVGHEPQVTESAKRFWAFRPVRRPEVPAVGNSQWVRTPIDAFILARLEAEGLRPAPPATKVALIRRAYYDLIGLPPSPEEVRAFLADDSPQAFERLVDRLLQSPHYGERWGRHWLDLVRYAETNSFERDAAKPFVWQYRDYVIDSLNADKPYDQFILEQLAGDELDEVTAESIIATGFYRLGPWDDEPSDAEQALYDDLDDILTTISQVFLGLTINCARCHNHKLDPIPQADYYRMLAFIRNVRRYGVRAHETVLDASVRVIATPEEQERFRRESSEHRRQLEQIVAQLKEIEGLVLPTLSDVEKQEFQHRQNRIPIIKKRVPEVLSAAQFEQYVQWTQRRNWLEDHPPAGLRQALCVKEHGPQPPATYILLRGSAHAPGEQVEPGFLSVLDPPAPEIVPRQESSGRRRALAQWIASPDNPLTARVMVNRIWQYHFGRGLVRSANNFGFAGDRPTHPELLDWLADEFVRSGWRMKHMHRLIMLSSAYQMSSQADPEALAKDPNNDWFWRFDMRRLTAEEIRDSILAVNGTLNLSRVGGPSIYPIIPPEVLHGQSRPGSGWGNSPPSERSRRSVYIHVKRSLIPPLISLFDGPDVDFSCPVRFTTTLPTQALTMLNSDFLNEQAALLAQAASNRFPDRPPDAVRWVLERVVQRPVTTTEVERGVTMIEQLRERDGLSPDQAMQAFCLMALNLNEFIYLD